MIIIPSNVSRLNGQHDLVNFNVKKSDKKFIATRVRLRDDIFRRLRQMLHYKKVTSSKLVKKSVRVDGDIYNSLLMVAGNNKEFFTNITSSAVIKEISTGQIDLIDARLFKRKITVYFTQEEYKYVQDVLDELKDRGLKSTTFSSLVRSILYKQLEIVIEIPVIEKSHKGILHNRGTTSGMATNPIRLGNKQQQKSYKISMKGYNYENQI